MTMLISTAFTPWIKQWVFNGRTILIACSHANPIGSTHLANFKAWLVRLYDRYYNTNYASSFLDKFEELLIANFSDYDGSILPIRSTATGFTIPGICGALKDLCNALYCRGYLDHVARRMWAVFKQENVNYDPNTWILRLVGLVGAYKIDPGYYKASDYMIYAVLSYIAGEYGDDKLRIAALNVLWE